MHVQDSPVMEEISRRSKETSVDDKTGDEPSASSGVPKTKRKRRSQPRDAPPQRSSMHRGVTRFVGEGNTLKLTVLKRFSSFNYLCNHFVLGIDGLGGTKRICGIRIVGTRHRARKEDKVSSLYVHIYSYVFDEIKIRRFDMFTPIYREDLPRRYCS